MNRKEVYSQLLRARFISEYSIGALLGLELTNEEAAEAEKRAIDFLQFLGFLPTTQDIVFCEEALCDANGNIALQNGTPILCGSICVPFAENRRLGFRLRCRGNSTHEKGFHHREVKISPLKTTIFQNSKLLFRDTLKVLFSFLKRRSVTECMNNFALSPNTVVDWYSIIREALAVVGWHSFRKIGKSIIVSLHFVYYLCYLIELIIIIM